MYHKYFKNNIVPVDKVYVIMLSRNSAHCKNHIQYLLFDLRIALMNGHAKSSILILFRNIFIVTKNRTISTCLIPQQLKHKTQYFFFVFFKNCR